MITAPESRVEVAVEGAVVGSAASMAIDEASGVVRLEGLDALANVFFAERAGAAGPDGAVLHDLVLREVPGGGEDLLRAHRATVRLHSSGSSEVSLDVSAAALHDATDTRRP